LKYNILGIGLREETAKLLCFAPLLPWLVWRRDELSALISAGCVGIGFGMEENVGYIGSSLASGTLGRLLTATPFHMALTGLVGVAAYRGCRRPRQWAAPFAATFVAAVLAHGLYDAFLQLPTLKDYNMAAGVIFLLCVFQFFSELRPQLKRRNDCISLTANFLACVSLVAAANFIYLCAAIGWQPAATALAQGVAAQGIMVYLFLREMPERLVDV
jgi:RsiW-degrading membrane proteinase PrsW (M82 family)